MKECPHFTSCEFVLRYVTKVSPHWDEFVNLYCRGSLQDICKRLELFNESGCCPADDLMPTGHRVPSVACEK